MELIVERNSFGYNGPKEGLREGLKVGRVAEPGQEYPGETAGEAIAVHPVEVDPSRLSLMADAELVREVARGSEQALESLYDRHVRVCFGLAVKIVRDPSVAEEVVQDVFVKLWSRPETFSPDKGKFSGWLLTLVHNRSVDKLRRAKGGSNGTLVSLDAENVGQMSLSEMLPDEGASPYEEVWQNERGRFVHQLLGLLPEKQRQMISMAYFEGLTQSEIAEQLHEPLGTVKTRTRSALQQLRRLQEQHGLMGELR